MIFFAAPPFFTFDSVLLKNDWAFRQEHSSHRGAPCLIRAANFSSFRRWRHADRQVSFAPRRVFLEPPEFADRVPAGCPNPFFPIALEEILVWRSTPEPETPPYLNTFLYFLVLHRLTHMKAVPKIHKTATPAKKEIRVLDFPNLSSSSSLDFLLFFRFNKPNTRKKTTAPTTAIAI